MYSGPKFTANLYCICIDLRYTRCSTDLGKIMGHLVNNSKRSLPASLYFRSRLPERNAEAAYDQRAWCSGPALSFVYQAGWTAGHDGSSGSSQTLALASRPWQAAGSGTGWTESPRRRRACGWGSGLTWSCKESAVERETGRGSLEVELEPYSLVEQEATLVQE